MLPILVAIDRQTTRPEASLDLIFEARARAILEYRIGTGAERENLADDIDGFAQAIRGAERTEIFAAVLDDLAGHHDAGPRMIGDLGAQVGFVVFEADVVARLVLLDEVVFEDQRFFLTARHQGVEVAHPPHQEAHLEALVAAVAEIGAHARAQRLRLARRRGPCRACPLEGRRPARAESHRACDRSRRRNLGSGGFSSDRRGSLGITQPTSRSADPPEWTGPPLPKWAHGAVGFSPPRSENPCRRRGSSSARCGCYLA